MAENKNHKNDNMEADVPARQDNAVRKTDTLVYALGGLGEVGKNMYCYEHENEICIVDCGVLFPETSCWASIMSSRITII